MSNRQALKLLAEGMVEDGWFIVQKQIDRDRDLARRREHGEHDKWIYVQTPAGAIKVFRKPRAAVFVAENMTIKTKPFPRYKARALRFRDVPILIKYGWSDECGLLDIARAEVVAGIGPMCDLASPPAEFQSDITEGVS